MRFHPIVFSALLLASIASAEPASRPARLGLCAACHGENGVATAAGIPHLAAQDRTYLADALRQYRNGARNAAAMRATAGALSDADIEALATWYASQTGVSGAKR